MTERKIADNVWQFIHRAGGIYAQMQEQRFGQEMQSNCLELGMESPIEDLFWVAMYAMSQAEYEEFCPTPELVNQTPFWRPGIYITPQALIGPYRVDFLVLREPRLEVQRTSAVVVELDGHAFHDKDKKQRAYEKGRDRYLVKQGHRVLHYTGSEIVADPFRVAHEVFVLLNAASTPEYNPADPLGVGA